MIKYRTSQWGRKLIEEVEVERETETSVWMKGSRSKKRTQYDNYFDTWDEAKAHLMDIAERSLDGARRRLQEAQGYHGNVKGLKRPN